MASKSNTSLTPTGTPTVNQTKRLSTVKTPGSPKNTKVGSGGGVKDVVSPGELCGFVRLVNPLNTSLAFSESIFWVEEFELMIGRHAFIAVGDAL